MRIKNFISTAALLSMAAFWVLLIARFPQPWFDRVFFFVFHLSFVGAAVLAVFALALVAVRISTPRGTAIAELISGVFAAISTLACSGLLVAAISLDPVFGVCLLSSIAAAAGCKRAAAAWKAHVTFRFYAAALPPLILFYVGVRYAAGAPPPASTIISFVIIMIAGAVFPGIIPSFNKSSLWENLVAARGAMLAAGAATALCYYSWAPALNNAGGKRLHVQSARIGGGTAMTFAPDGKHIVYLNKKKLELNLVNTITLRIEKTIPFPGGPRDIDYDPATGRYYAIRYSSPKRQLEVIDTDAFKTVTAVNLPETWCSLANAVAVDSERSRALVGCDDTGQVFFVDLKHLEKPAVRARPKLSGKGLVRIEIDKKNASALTVGCLLGPYLNEIDLKTAKALRSEFTGFTAWETARDPARRRLFVSIPFRSIVAVVDEKTLKVVREIPSGLGARALAADVTGRRLFVGSQLSSTVEVFDLDSFKRIGRFYVFMPRYFVYDVTKHELFTAGTAGIYKIKI